MIRVVETGKHPAMEQLNRSHRVDLAFLDERLAPQSEQRDNVGLIYELSERMAADIYTKAFSDMPRWAHACRLLNIFDPKCLDEELKLLYTQPPPRPKKVKPADEDEQLDISAGGIGLGVPVGVVVCGAEVAPGNKSQSRDTKRVTTSKEDVPKKWGRTLTPVENASRRELLNTFLAAAADESHPSNKSPPRGGPCVLPANTRSKHYEPFKDKAFAEVFCGAAHLASACAQFGMRS